MKYFDNIYILIPVFNEKKVIKKLILNLKKNFKYIIAVNDGSYDGNREILEELDIILINHPINLGQGAAIKTGLEYINNYLNGHAVITFDADGQHSVEDAVLFADNILTTDKDIIFGSRFIKNSVNVPFLKKIMLKTATLITNQFLSLNLTDTHNGLKAIKTSVLQKINLSIDGYAFETELIIEIAKNQIPYIELPTDIKYTEYSKQKGQGILNSIRIFEDIIFKLIRKQ